MTAGSGRPPAVGYTLRVAGRLDGRWATRFDGFTLTADPDGTTTLAGVVTDQAQLHGLLAQIRDLGLELISLNHTTAIAHLVEQAPAAPARLPIPPG